MDKLESYSAHIFELGCMRWNNIERKCRAKAEEYK